MGRKGQVSQLWPDYGHPAALSEPLADYIGGAEWWLCTSSRSLQQLMLAMRRQEVAIVLYEQVGSIYQLGRTPEGRFVLSMQLARPGGLANWALDLGLSDAGIRVEERYNGEENVTIAFTREPG